jgi:hypothetical protein
MDAQLRLLTAPASPAARRDPVDPPIDEAPALEQGPVSWRLSARTRDLGRRGIAEARDQLRRAQPYTADHDHDRDRRNDRDHDGPDHRSERSAA